MPVNATLLPNKMSMWTTSPKDVGRGRRFGLREDLSMVVVRPMSVIGSVSLVDKEKVGWEVVYKADKKGSIFRKPKLLRN